VKLGSQRRKRAFKKECVLLMYYAQKKGYKLHVGFLSVAVRFHVNTLNKRVE
jgi:hypothetical protein